MNRPLKQKAFTKPYTHPAPIPAPSQNMIDVAAQRGKLLHNALEKFIQLEKAAAMA